MVKVQGIALILGLVLVAGTTVRGQEAKGPAETFAAAVQARTKITFQGQAVVTFRSGEGKERAARFRIYQQADGATRWEYLNAGGELTAVAVRVQGKQYVWTPQAESRVREMRARIDDRYSNLALILANYAALGEGEETVAGRRTSRVRLHCKFGNRPPTRVWVDAQNRMILKEVRYDLSGRPLVERYFEEVSFPGELEAKLFVPPAQGRGREGRPEAPRKPVEERLEEVRRSFKDGLWLPEYVPEGFKLTAVRSYPYQVKETTRHAVHLGYSDGLTAMSVFIQEGVEGGATTGPGRSRGQHGAGERPAGTGPPPGEGAEDPGPAGMPGPLGEEPGTEPVVFTYRGLEITDQSRENRTVFRRQADGVSITVIGEIDRTDLLNTIVSVEREEGNEGM